MLILTNITCLRQGRPLFQGLEFTLCAGKLLHITGKNGSGKTSLLHILLGFLKPYTGHMAWCGAPRTPQDTRYRMQLAYVGHLAGVRDSLTALENLRLAGQLHNAKNISDSDCYHALAYFALTQKAHALCKHLSSGERRRLALAKLRLLNTKLWLLDEPFTSLDLRAKTLLQSLLQSHLQKGGMVVLTHHGALDLPNVFVKCLDLAQFQCAN